MHKNTQLKKLKKDIIDIFGPNGDKNEGIACVCVEKDVILNDFKNTNKRI